MEVLDCLEVLRRGTPSAASPCSPPGLPETPVNRFGAGLTPLSSGRVGGVNLSRALGRRSAPTLNLDDVSPVGSSGRTPLAGASGRTQVAGSSLVTPMAGSSLVTPMAGSSLITPMAVPGRAPRVAGDDETPQKVELTVKSARAGRSVLGEITNIVAGECNAGLSPLKAPLPTPSSISVGRVRSPGLDNSVATPQTASMRQPSFAIFDEALDSPDAATTSLSDISLRSQEDSFCNMGLEVSRIDEAFDEDDEGADEGDGAKVKKAFMMGGNARNLPSVGSADHRAGTCKRCNFFAKGRCQNDLNCKFCHLPHSKRKVSQHEKRERRAAWLLEQGTAPAGDDAKVATIAEVGAEEQEQATVSYTMLPGFPSMPLPPPGLSPPRRSAQSGATPVAPGLLATGPLSFAACDEQPAAATPGVKQTATMGTQTSPQKTESTPRLSGLRV